MPDVAPVERALRRMAWPARSALVFEASGIEAFDTGGAVVLYRALMEARRQGCEVSIQGLRPDYAQLMSLVSSHWGLRWWLKSPRGQNGTARLTDSRSAVILPRVIRGAGVSRGECHRAGAIGGVAPSHALAQLPE
jgi:ABC-type transporter Mla MlaB component